MEYASLVLNGACVFLSAAVSVYCFNNDNKFGGWLNLFASALNVAIVGNNYL